MEGIRVAGLFYENRGPMVFSASLHLILLVVYAVYMLVSPDKEPEELVFILQAPPPSGYVEEQPLEALKYDSEDVPMPTLEELQPPKPPPKVEQAAPKPVETKTIEMPAEKPKPKLMTFEEFEAQAGPVKDPPKPKPSTKPRTRPKIDVSNLTSRLENIEVSSVSLPNLSSLSQGDQDAMQSYIAGFIQAIRNRLESHPVGREPLRVRVRCDIAASGLVSNAAIVQGSGDSAFDQKILTALQSLRYYEAPPSGQSFPNTQFTLKQEG